MYKNHYNVSTVQVQRPKQKGNFDPNIVKIYDKAETTVKVNALNVDINIYF